MLENALAKSIIMKLSVYSELMTDERF